MARSRTARPSPPRPFRHVVGERLAPDPRRLRTAVADGLRTIDPAPAAASLVGRQLSRLRTLLDVGEVDKGVALEAMRDERATCPVTDASRWPLAALVLWAAVDLGHVDVRWEDDDMLLRHGDGGRVVPARLGVTLQAPEASVVVGAFLVASDPVPYCVGRRWGGETLLLPARLLEHLLVAGRCTLRSLQDVLHTEAADHTGQFPDDLAEGLWLDRALSAAVVLLQAVGWAQVELTAEGATTDVRATPLAALGYATLRTRTDEEPAEGTANGDAAALMGSAAAVSMH